MMKPTEFKLDFYGKLKHFNVKLENIVDVGCFRGAWTELVQKAYPDANYYLIDPNDHHKQRCEKLGTFIHAAVGFKEEERTFYYYNEDSATGNSLYRETSNAKPFQKVVKVKPLSALLPNKKYDVIKMDVQGAELEIIDGSFDLFSKTKFIQLECPVHHNNVDAPRFEHYINFMSNCDFKVFDIDNIFYNKKLMGVDFVFVNKKLPKVTELENEKIIYESFVNEPSA